MLITKSLQSSLPLERREKIIEKMKAFEMAILNNKTYRELNKGFWVRKIESTNKYKFRINNGDRIVFEYGTVDEKEQIIFLKYCHHDQQIRVAKNYTNGAIMDYEIDTTPYIEEEIDKDIDWYIKSDVYTKLAEIQSNAVVGDDFISLYVDENNLLPGLSFEQFECISVIDKPIIVLGCAGSGKTIIAIQKMAMNNELQYKTLYLTTTRNIINRVQDIYKIYSLNQQYNVFSTFVDFCSTILGLNTPIIIDADDFAAWLNQSKFSSFIYMAQEIWFEINNTIKGKLSPSGGKLLTASEYHSININCCDLKREHLIYQIAQEYQSWLDAKNYFDCNDLAYSALTTSLPSYDYVIFDEAEELTEKQLEVIVQLTDKINNIMLLGDTNQSLHTDMTFLKLFKRKIYDKDTIPFEKYISKNYRNGDKTVTLINELERIKWQKYDSVEHHLMQPELPMKAGILPCLLSNIRDTKKLFRDVENDPDSIIIVIDKKKREELKKQGFSTGRVFTVSDVRGLEYEKIFCYNLMSEVHEIWDNILSIDEKCEEYTKYYFNALYIATSRSRKNTIFVEQRKNRMSDELKKHMKCLDNEQDIFEIIRPVENNAIWLEEAHRLIQLEKYEQAAAAYTKAHRPAEAALCLKAHKRTLDFVEMEGYAGYIKIRLCHNKWLIFDEK